MAHWNFEGVTGVTAPDVADGDNPATLSGSPIVIPDGASGKGLNFDAIDDTAVIANHTDLVSSYGSFALSAWINPAEVVINRTQYIIWPLTVNTDLSPLLQQIVLRPNPACQY
jgi:hypothetical protein